DVCMLDGGQIMIPGVGIEATFAKGLLDKVGVKADYVQIGEYKGADEQFTRTEPTPELRGELNKLMDALYAQIVDGIARHRKLPADSVKQLIDEALVSARTAKARGLVDHLVDQDGLRDLLTETLGDKIDLLHHYGQDQREAVDLSSPFGFFALFAKKPEETSRPAVALIYAAGTIIDGQGGEGMFGDGFVGSDTMRQALRSATRDENIKAIVIRIDSPGGSAVASEAMWQAARRAAAKKPLVISIGGMAASGGYYLASAGDMVFADSTAIVGSIGVVGGKFVLKDLYDKLGLTSEAFLRGRNADLFSSNQPFNERQRKLITGWMRETYDQFTERVMTTRQGKIQDIDQVARGRIFLARDAKQLGMVDEIGGMQQAIAHAARKVDLESGEFDVKVLPAPKTLADLFTGRGDQDEFEARLPIRPRVKIGEESILRLLSPGARRALMQQVHFLQLLQERPVILASPFTIHVR
ncbi:MAG: signal peptide peptidase SppA, partial [Tepidisphaeraceae bacterium]